MTEDDSTTSTSRSMPRERANEASFEAANSHALAWMGVAGPAAATVARAKRAASSGTDGAANPARSTATRSLSPDGTLYCYSMSGPCRWTLGAKVEW